ncbi:hypothetical protein TWF970_009850 [Orbilia oligospora]|uniref:AB hydrolase-1 domain-containing protein n=1 Tax=Orbilia oligospora TaxID=2813651 RepID=A0A7C8R7M0_ORBOL|nr:hypothetical protein TWF970_009850 [Orbilia oligospora]
MQSFKRIPSKLGSQARTLATARSAASPALADRKWKLEWTPRTAPAPEPPTGFARDYIETTDGRLELLKTISKESIDTDKPPLFFQHGGFGCADNYIPWMEYFSKRGYPCYALSIRGHGYSWGPSYYKTVFQTTAPMLAHDVAAGVRHVTDFHKKDPVKRRGGGLPVLLGHSNGGGLSQMLLDRGYAKASALVILAGTPNFGGWGVYKNWGTFDPWFVPRMYFRDLFHPRSPLSKTSLVHRAFFCDEFPREEVKEFEKKMSPYLSYWWPIQIMGRFVKTENVLSNLTGWGGGRVFILAAERDRLMSLELMGRMADEYRKQRASMVRSKVFTNDGRDIDQNWISGESERTIFGGLEGVRDGIAYRVVEGAGHHLQNDLQKNISAKYLEQWLEILDKA